MEPERGPRPAAADGGLDLGWALACAGLLLAAGLLGLSEDGRKAQGRGGQRLNALLRLRLGRR